MKLTLIEVPYDSGHYARRMGLGPVRIVQDGLAGQLEAEGHEVRLVEVRIEEDFVLEVGSALEIQRLVAECVAAEIAEGRFPLVLSGNCATSVGTVAGLTDAVGSPPAVVWLDSHGDFNTPETSGSGFFDGMVLSMLTGHCWAAAASRVPGFRPVPEDSLLLVGARDFDPAEEERLESSTIRRFDVASIRSERAHVGIREALLGMGDEVAGAYLHVDLDVLDPEAAHINPYQAPDGLSVNEVLNVVSTVADSGPLRAAALTAYAPEWDQTGAGAEAALRIAKAIAELAN